MMIVFYLWPRRKEPKDKAILGHQTNPFANRWHRWVHTIDPQRSFYVSTSTARCPDARTYSAQGTARSKTYHPHRPNLDRADSPPNIPGRPGQRTSLHNQGSTLLVHLPCLNAQILCMGPNVPCMTTTQAHQDMGFAPRTLEADEMARKASIPVHTHTPHRTAMGLSSLEP